MKHYRFTIFLFITFFWFLLSGIFSGVYAADNMCNVNPGSCSTPEQWEAGWYAAREPENQNAAPAQPEYTQRNEGNEGTAAPDRPVEIIRLAGEGNSTNRSKIAADDAKARGGDPVNPSSVTADPIALDPKTLQPIGGAGTGGGSGSGAAACWGIGGGQVERDCLARAAGGVYTSGGCRGMNVAQCAAWAQANGYRTQYCSGNQESAGTTRAGEFLSCGKTGTNGCGQIDILDAKGEVMGFIIDKSGCGGNTPTTTTQNAPPRIITSTTTGNPTPTPTPTPALTCETIRVYDSSGTDITASLKNGGKKLAIGEEVTIATTKGTATKARFRIQGIADWAEHDPAKSTATEYRLTTRIPTALTQSQGTFEVEVFVGGVWK